VNKAQKAKDQRLAELESEFVPLLTSCLEECASGRWGLFGQNDSVDAARHLAWGEADRLQEITREIHKLREEFGQPNALCERFLYFCAIRGPNVPGEPKIAKMLLDEMSLRG
jgi:hypothetical protein